MKRRVKILVADNNTDSTAILSEFLQGQNYEVVIASNPRDARKILERGEIDLALLDLRLDNDHDESDKSGLRLAENRALSAIPKIMMSTHLDFYDVRTALGLVSDPPPAVDFLSKADGLAAVAKSVRQALRAHAPLNLDLVIRCPEQSPLDWVVSILGDEAVGTSGAAYSRELEKLLCRAFHNFSGVTVKVIPTARRGEVLAWVETESEGMTGPARLLRLTSSARATHEEHVAQRYGLLTEEWALLWSNVKSVNFGAWVYKAKGFELDSARTLADCFRYLTVKEANRALDGWFEKISETLYQERCPAAEEVTLGSLYRARLGLEALTERVFASALREVAEYAESTLAGGVRYDRKARRLDWQLGEVPAVSCPDPSLYVFDSPRQGKRSVIQRLCLGKMDGQNILIDEEGRPWIVNATSVGPGPALSDFTALESHLRSVWSRGESGWETHLEVERRLSAQPTLDTPPDLSETGEGRLDRDLAIIAHARRLAARVPGADIGEYQLGLLFHAARVVADPSAELHARARALLTAAFAARRLEDSAGRDGA
jgi:CheY-like chemotaxis protein